MLHREPLMQHPDDGVEQPASTDPLSRWVLAGIGTGFLVVTFAQARGLIEDDTKLPLILTPVAYFKSAIHLWSDHLFAGAATQSADLLFPMGPFFAFAQLFHIPTWCAERIWLALLFTVGCWGVVRLAEALGIGRRYARVLAGVAYCVSPIVLPWTTTTAALLAIVLLPWVIRPLVTGSREGSPRRAAGRSGIAVALMGGANATVVLAVLPVGVIWLLTRRPCPRRRALMGWWVVAVGCACFWWAVSLLLAGRYGYNYLPYTETASVTTSTASAFESLRGASYWTDYYTLGGALLPGAWTVVSSATVIIATSVVTGLGLAGLCRRAPERFFLVASMTVGVVAIAIGYAGPLGGPFAHALQPLLDTRLAPLRNVTKFAPDVALPLALGVAAILSPQPRRQSRRARSSPRIAFVVGVTGVTVAAIVLAATPFWRLHLYGTGGFQAIPNYWNDAGTWLDAHQGHQNALLVPGANSGQYTWGDPVDEPLEVVSHIPILWSDVIPLGSNGSTQTLNAVEQAFDSGTSPPGFAQFLAREGIRYVVERNDLNLSTTGAPPPAQVHQVLADTPGLTEVASFGPIIPKLRAQVGTLPVYDSPRDSRLRSVEIFRVSSSGSAVRTYPVANPVVVSGDAASLLPLEGADVLQGRAAFLAGDPLAHGAVDARQATWAISDGNQRRDLGFGGVRNNTSYVLGPGQTLSSKPAHIPLTYTVVPGGLHETVEAPIGAASASASSYGSSTLYDQPIEGPYSAFDGNPATAWVANAAMNSIGQWISITFNHPISLSTINVTPVPGSAQQPAITGVTISTDSGSVRRSLPAHGGPVRLVVPAGSSRSLKLTIDSVKPALPVSANGIAEGAGIEEIKIPGVSFQQNLSVPDDEARTFASPRRNPPILVFNRQMPNANLSLGSPITDDSAMARTFHLPTSMATAVTGYAVPMPGPQLESLLQFLTPATSKDQQISASSWLGDLPRFRAENLLVSGDSPWIAGLGDLHPSVTLTWNGLHTIDSIVLTPTRQASRPTEISVSSPTGGSQLLPVPLNGGLIHFAPMVTNILRIEFVPSPLR